jgi:hypothetical protein
MYQRIQKKRKVHEDGIIFRDGEVMHHDGAWHCDRHGLFNDAILGYNSVNQVWSKHLVREYEHLP